MTKILKISGKKPNKKKIREAAKVIMSGGVIIFPTETVYGIACSPFKKKAVERIFKLKGRNWNKPLAVIVENFKQVKTLTKNLSPKAKEIMSRYWPGPLTLVLNKSSEIPAYVTARLKKVGIRMPDHPISKELIRTCGIPLVATSANISGSADPKTARQALKQLIDVDLLIDGGRTQVGKASTVIDATGKKVKILRKGPLIVRV